LYDGEDVGLVALDDDPEQVMVQQKGKREEDA
jgi:hypothetical protein